MLHFIFLPHGERSELRLFLCFITNTYSMNLKFPFSFLILLGCFSLSWAQVSLTAGAVTIDFAGFTGTGLVPTPAAGQLDSDTWVITGMSDGDTSPGGTHTTGDFTRGATAGGVTTGGLYAYTGGATAPGLWIQPTGIDMNPGTIQLLVCNNTGATLTGLDLAYDIVVLNDQGRSSSVGLAYSSTGFGGTFTAVPALDFFTEEIADGLTTVTPRSTTISGLSIADGDCMALSWTTDDFTGTGNRDELGLDNIVLTPITTVTADRLSYRNAPATATVGTSFTIDVCAVDAGGNIDVGYVPNILLANAGPIPFSIAPAASVAPTNGCVTYTITPLNSSVLSFAATSGILNGGTGAPYLYSLTALSGLNVFISEYIEGSSDNKCIEIYNGSGVAIDLAAEGYLLTQLSNGGTSPSAGSPIALTGTIAPGDVHVICNDNVGPDFLPQTDQLNGSLSYSGNDAIALSNTLIGVLDVVGAVTGDPGNGWTGGGCSTQNFTLVRSAAVTTGDTDPTDAFDPSAEWDCYAQDTWAFLGNHGTPVAATTLGFYVEPPTGCLEDGGYFRVEICAQDANGFPQPDFASDITLSLGSGTGPITVAGGATTTPVFGCTTFFVRSESVGPITLTATAPGVSSATTASLPISATCSEITPVTGVFDPCGNESQNEYLAARNGNGTLDVADLMIGQINHIAGVQPNYNFTWNLTGTVVADNPNPTCNTSSNVCNRLLNVNNAADLTILTTLRDALNLQAGCTLFALPNTSGTGGEIPADAYFITFLGAGGNGTAGSEGFDDVANNLDFSAFCGSVPVVYLVAGERSGTATGFFTNSASRTYRIRNGAATRDLEYGIPTGPNSAQSVSADGTVFSPATVDCTPNFLFSLSPFPVELLSFSATPAEPQSVQLAWITASELNNDRFIVQRSIDRVSFTEIGTVNGAGTTQEMRNYEFLDERPVVGVNYYRLLQIDLDGTEHPSPLAEARIAGPEAFALLEAYPNPTTKAYHLHLHLPVAGQTRLSLYSTSGQLALRKVTDLQAGLQEWEIDLEALPAGLYLYQIDLNGKTLFGKLVKQ